MKRILYIMFFLLPCPLIRAQQVSVSATITDSDGNAWANGSFSVALVSPNGAPQYNGTVVSTAPQSGTLNSSGALSVTLYTASTVTPAGAFYQWIICSNTSAPCSVFNSSVVQSSMSTVLDALITTPRFAVSPVAYGYADVEVTPIPLPGGFYYNVTLAQQRIWNGTAWADNSGSPVTNGEEVIASSTTPAFTAGTLGSIIVLSNNVTSWTMASGLFAGQQKTVTWCENSTGGFTVTGTPSNVRGAFNPFSTATTANTCSTQVFTWHTDLTTPAWGAVSTGYQNW
jgi:hypothetical protein